MRQRKVKHLDEKLQAVSRYMVEDPSPGVWKEVFRDAGTEDGGRPLYLEIGCGRGDFLLQQALAHPEADFVGIEGQASVVLRAMEKAAAAAEAGTVEPAGGAASLCENLRFACAFVNGLEELLAGSSQSKRTTTLCLILHWRRSPPAGGPRPK